MSSVYIPVSLFSPSQLIQMLNQVAESVRITNLEYDLLFNSLYSSNDQKMVTFLLILNLI